MTSVSNFHKPICLFTLSQILASMPLTLRSCTANSTSTESINLTKNNFFKQGWLASMTLRNRSSTGTINRKKNFLSILNAAANYSFKRVKSYTVPPMPKKQRYSLNIKNMTRLKLGPDQDQDYNQDQKKIELDQD